MKIDKRDVWAMGLIFVLSLAFFMINIQFPKTVNFDEFHYLPAIRAYLLGSENRNWEHPPLAKYFMTLGYVIGGDTPFGWRWMSTVFGALTLSGMYFLANAFGFDFRSRIFVVLVTLFNQMLYVQSRIVMLDTYMMAFLVWAISFFICAWRETNSRLQEKYFLISGILFGLGTSCKWFTLMAWIPLFGLVFLIALNRRLNADQAEKAFKKAMKKAKKGEEKEEEHLEKWFSYLLFKDLNFLKFFLYFLLIPGVVYLATFIPLLFLKSVEVDFFTLFKMQYDIWDGQLRVINSHPYMSHWSDWAILKRPIWYAFDKEGDRQEWVRGVLMIGNPLLMWGGLVALLYNAFQFKKEHTLKAFFVLFFYAVFYFSWMLIPRKIAFYYYYYPAGMILSFAFATALEKQKRLQEALVVAAAIMFIYFFPVLAALKIPTETFGRWMWFQTWI